eukprot:3464704-Rhodomonas_salina.2
MRRKEEAPSGIPSLTARGCVFLSCKCALFWCGSACRIPTRVPGYLRSSGRSSGGPPGVKLVCTRVVECSPVQTLQPAARISGCSRKAFLSQHHKSQLQASKNTLTL